RRSAVRAWRQIRVRKTHFRGPALMRSLDCRARAALQVHACLPPFALRVPEHTSLTDGRRSLGLTMARSPNILPKSNEELRSVCTPADNRYFYHISPLALCALGRSSRHFTGNR